MAHQVSLFSERFSFELQSADGVAIADQQALTRAIDAANEVLDDAGVSAIEAYETAKRLVFVGHDVFESRDDLALEAYEQLEQLAVTWAAAENAALQAATAHLPDAVYLYRLTVIWDERVPALDHYDWGRFKNASQSVVALIQIQGSPRNHGLNA